MRIMLRLIQRKFFVSLVLMMLALLAGCGGDDPDVFLPDGANLKGVRIKDIKERYGLKFEQYVGFKGYLDNSFLHSFIIKTRNFPADVLTEKQIEELGNEVVEGIVFEKISTRELSDDILGAILRDYSADSIGRISATNAAIFRDGIKLCTVEYIPYGIPGCVVQSPGSKGDGGGVREYIVTKEAKLDSVVFSEVDFSEKPIQISELSHVGISSGDHESSCSRWALSKEDVLKILQLSKRISGEAVHHFFYNAGCEFRGKMTVEEEHYDFIVNGGSYLYIYKSGSKGVYFGCSADSCQRYFLLAPDLNTE